ncbi:MAG: TlpA disulfide reductase family protein [Solirubrobacterales bacterium]
MLVSTAIVSLCRADACPVGASVLDDNAAAMVRAIRQSEQWIHQVDNLHLRLESVWTQMQPSPATSAGLLEYAFDKNRLRFLDDRPDQRCLLKIWNGKELIARDVQAGRREQYLLDAAPEGNFSDILGSETAWPRSQPHAFWWDRRDVDALAAFYGRPEEFKCVGRQMYRDVECQVLEMRPAEVRAILHGESYGCDSGSEDQQEHGLIGEVRGLVDQSCRWYVGVEDGRLRGITWFIAERPRLEHWMSDYREVVPGGWLPMTQGYQVYNKDKDERPFVERRRDLKVVKCEVNSPLADDLFRLEIREGASVQDKRSGQLVVYEYQPQPTDLLGKPLPALDPSMMQLDTASMQGRPVLMCFWDMDQRPSRHCVRQLAQQSQRLSELGVKVVAVQMAQTDPAVLSRWIQENRVDFPILTPSDGADGIRSAWRIRSLPWLVLADENHVVTAMGGTLDDLNAHVARVAKHADQWAAALR